ncbi:hypothetical protein CRG98_033457 [Punica granatum]|uniref:Uncharacterized protein n=1 Tax=Punica granatum TaxID=22663 RepID=A0A2I0IQ42_PUNGR|nr:hypothetical protein CRG98_033457 [Punica granatum]
MGIGTLSPSVMSNSCCSEAILPNTDEIQFGEKETRSSERNQTISSRFGEFGDWRFREPSPENRDNPPILTDLAPVRSRSTTAKHRRRLEPSPASSPAVVAAFRGKNRHPPASLPPLPSISAALRLTGLGPFLFLCGLGPFRPNASSPALVLFRTVSPSGQSDPIRPIRSDPIRPVGKVP